jgi:hypothetical protein
VDFIEQFFGVSPDGGSGATEDLLVAVFIAIVCGFGVKYWLRSRVGSRETEVLSKRNH